MPCPTFFEAFQLPFVIPQIWVPQLVTQITTRCIVVFSCVYVCPYVGIDSRIYVSIFAFM